MKNVIQGLIAGLLAGIFLAVLYFVDYGPGNGLHNIARWFGLDSPSAGRLIGFILMIVLGAVFGVLFGFLQRNRETTLPHALLLGLLTGAILWIIAPLLLGALINHASLNLSTFLSSFVPLLTYGLLTGAIYFQRAR